MTAGPLARMLAGAEDLGLDGDTLNALAAAWEHDDCTTAGRRLGDAVTARLDRVQAAIAVRQRQMAGSGPGTRAWAEVTRTSVSLFEEAARLQAVSGALAAAAHPGPCGEACGCVAALATPATAYHFASDTAADETALVCDLAADGGDAHDRIDVWQQALSRVERREPLPDADGSAQIGVALRFPLDVDLAATLGRLAAAEYRCCSFGSYAIVIDGAGLRLEIRMPSEAADTLAAVVGLPFEDARASTEAG